MRKSFTYAITLSAVAVALAGCAPVASAYSPPSAHAGAAGSTGTSAGAAGASKAYGAYGAPAANGGKAAAALPLAATMTKLGTTLADGSKTVYVFGADKPNAMTSACTGDCLNDWPPVLVTGAAPKIMGVTGTLGTISAWGGKKQLTIDGHPLYTFSGDQAAGDVNGQGISEFGGLWWAVGPSGAKVTAH
jgi:predicted lipoprotein with Yx(FWY)xxD motif